MTINRKDFIKKACLTGACACGIGSITMGRTQLLSEEVQDKPATNPNALQQAWISALLDRIDDTMTEEELRKALKPCALTHYDAINMSDVIKDYFGDIDKFVNYLTTEWNWKVDYDKTTGRIVCDENKDHCVCPMVNKEKGIASPSICFCSEGFIEKMFTVVAGKPVTTKVATSILRGDASCRYIVNL
jgi:hypothetical protein